MDNHLTSVSCGFEVTVLKLWSQKNALQELPFNLPLVSSLLSGQWLQETCPGFQLNFWQSPLEFWEFSPSGLPPAYILSWKWARFSLVLHAFLFSVISLYFVLFGCRWCYWFDLRWVSFQWSLVRYSFPWIFSKSSYFIIIIYLIVALSLLQSNCIIIADRWCRKSLLALSAWFFLCSFSPESSLSDQRSLRVSSWSQLLSNALWLLHSK